MSEENKQPTAEETPETEETTAAEQTVPEAEEKT